MAHHVQQPKLSSPQPRSDQRADQKDTAVLPDHMPDHSLMLFFALVAGTAFLATQLLVEDNLFVLGWQFLLSPLAGSNSHYWHDLGHNLPVALLHDAALILSAASGVR